MKTYSAKPGEVTRNWWVIDAEGKNLGRLAVQIAIVLRGKNKPQFTPHTDTGDFVVVVNADKVAVTGKKMTDKKYYRHTGTRAASRSGRWARCWSVGRTKCCAWRSRACCRRTGSPPSN